MQTRKTILMLALFLFTTNLLHLKAQTTIAPNSSPSANQNEVGDSSKISNSKNEVNKKETYTWVDKMPEFPGGDDELMNRLHRSIIYPAYEKQNNIEGKVILRFIITEDGGVDSIIVARGITPGLDNEAVRVLSSLPKWHPGKEKGVAVRVYYMLPVVFRL